MFRWATLSCVCFAACHPEEAQDTGDPRTGDTPADDSGLTDDSGKSCTLAPVGTLPEEGASDWLYSDPLTVTFNAPAQKAALGLADGGGAAVEFTPTWSEDGTEVSLAAAFAPSSSYTLSITACDTTATVDFTTSAYGTPLSLDPSALVGRTYHLDLAAAEYTEPAAADVILSTFVTADLLLGIVAADAKTIDFLGTQGYEDGEGVFHQDDGLPTYGFANADFTAQPYATATTPAVQIQQSGSTYTFYDFTISGTFASDGSSIGGATIDATLDTTPLGTAMGLGDDPMAACDSLDLLGIACQACPTAGKYDNCLPVVARIDEAPQLVGLTLHAGG
jgi:hypothetical protein